MAEFPKSNLKLRREQRKYLRYPVEGEAMLLLPEPGKSFGCAMVDLGLEGCCLHHVDAMAMKAGMPVEVSFRLAGLLFRFAGTLQWVARSCVMGIHFERMDEQKRQELAEVLGGLREELEAREREAQAQVQPAAGKEEPQAAKRVPSPSAKKRERRQHARHLVKGTARVRFLSLHSTMTGKIMDLSLGGCRISSASAIPVGVYRRVEVEFRVDGTPMLLPGVTQSLHDPRTVGIRFVEVTERKRRQLKALIEELEEKVKAV